MPDRVPGGALVWLLSVLIAVAPQEGILSEPIESVVRIFLPTPAAILHAAADEPTQTVRSDAGRSAADTIEIAVPDVVGVEAAATATDASASSRSTPRTLRQRQRQQQRQRRSEAFKPVVLDVSKDAHGRMRFDDRSARRKYTASLKPIGLLSMLLRPTCPSLWTAESVAAYQHARFLAFTQSDGRLASTALPPPCLECLGYMIGFSPSAVHAHRMLFTMNLFAPKFPYVALGAAHAAGPRCLRTGAFG